MIVRFQEKPGDGPVAFLSARVDGIAEHSALHYATRTGAVLRVGGRIAGAFDRQHELVPLPAQSGEVELQLEVERRSLPTSGLPAGDGFWWRRMVRKAKQTPSHQATIVPYPPRPQEGAAATQPLFAHAHLDVAWLWTYAETVRKAIRTFATAVRQLERYPAFVFLQSQPQLYAFVEEADGDLFAQVQAFVREGRFDACAAALWVEPDCNVPSGESLLRQMLAASRYCRERFEVTPSVAWLPDTFGFANTLPTLLAHAGIPYFATAKLQWNDTTRLPYAQFVWQGPDGAEITSALLDSFEGDFTPIRVSRARQRHEPLVLGYGDGGGGATDAMIDRGPRYGKWTSVADWFKTLDPSTLPRHRDELYLEYHRGTYTTHHDVKAGNFALERALDYAEELAAWCIAVGAPAPLTDDLRARLREAWQIVLRNQFHDVLPGTSIGAVYDDVHAEYDRADALVGDVVNRARQTLPRMPVRERFIERCEAYERDGRFVLDNGLVSAIVGRDGSLRELRAGGGRNALALGNRLGAYRDRPKAWEAWNIDRGYERRPRRLRFVSSELRSGAVVTTYALGKSRIEQRIALFAAEPFVRVDAEVEWNERRTLLRTEHWLALRTASGTFGSPHGTIVRRLDDPSQAAQAKYEFPAQRFACFEDANGGLAILTTDSYGWSARALRTGGVATGLSLLRGTRWPDPDADRGSHHFAYAFLPYETATIGAIERTWRSYAYEPRVRLFTCDDDGVAIVACKPADDGDGVIIRVRECDGAAREVTLKSTARARTVSAVDGLERPLDAALHYEGGTLRFMLGAYGLRSFRVRYGA